MDEVNKYSHFFPHSMNIWRTCRSIKQQIFWKGLLLDGMKA